MTDMQKVKIILYSFTTVVLTNGCHSERLGKEKVKPNVVFILADDLGFGDLGCYGAVKVKTPNVDYLANSGIRYLDAHSSGSVSQPSRYGILTGEYYWKSEKAMRALEKRSLNGYMPAMLNVGEQTLAKLFKENDYYTAMVGKWHLGACWQTENKGLPRKDGMNVIYEAPIQEGPVDHGFDYYYGIMGSHGMPPYCFVENDKVEHIPTKYRIDLPHNAKKGAMDPLWKDEELGIKLTDKAIEIIREAALRDSSFFLYFCLSAPHTPYTPSKLTLGKSEAGLRGDMVAEVDWSVGQIINVLRETGQYDNTIIVLTSDNGGVCTGMPVWAVDPVMYEIEDYGHRPNGYLKGQKGDTWEGGHRVPLIVSWPKMIKEADICDALVCQTDFYPTFTEMLCNVSEDDKEKTYSFFSTWFGEPYRGREYVIHHAYRDDIYAIRSKKWKYIDVSYSGGFMSPFTYPEMEKYCIGGQLYDMENDPVEVQNVYALFSDTSQFMKDILRKYTAEKVYYDKTK